MVRTGALIAMGMPSPFSVTIWNPASFKWHPGGPTDANVVLIDFVAYRIELWSLVHGITPDPTKGLWATALSRERDGWRPHLTLPSA